MSWLFPLSMNGLRGGQKWRWRWRVRGLCFHGPTPKSQMRLSAFSVGLGGVIGLNLNIWSKSFRWTDICKESDLSLSKPHILPSLFTKNEKNPGTVCYPASCQHIAKWTPAFRVLSFEPKLKFKMTISDQWLGIIWLAKKYVCVHSLFLKKKCRWNNYLKVERSLWLVSR